MISDADFTNDYFHNDELGPSSETPCFEVGSLPDAIELLDEIVQLGSGDASQSAIVEFGTLLRRLADTLDDHNGAVDKAFAEEADELTGAVIQGANALRHALAQEPASLDELIQLREALLAEYEDRLLIDLELEDEAWAEDMPPDANFLEEPDFAQPSAEEIGLLLSELHAVETPRESSCDLAETHNDAQQEDDFELIDDELRLAFLDDADRCLAAMEAALLSLESNLTSREPLAALGRELHTLKGASGSIGLSALADYIHAVEDAIRDDEADKQPVDMEVLLKHVDTIRSKVDLFRNANSEVPTSIAESGVSPQQPTLSADSPPAPKAINFDDNSADDESIRVKSSKLNRLMDMLSELVMLRNRRDTELSRLIAIQESLIESVGRLRMLNQDQDALRSITNPAAEDKAAECQSPAKTANEIANEILESAQHLRECYQPVADGNKQVSQFIRGFRQELVELRRTPIAGLFLRLRRAVSDAARSEGKQVQLTLVGEETGIESSLQARLFEPLLHIVRNSVSHGIESPAQRIANGKPEQGTITLRADSGPDLLVIEVRDDGCGLDFETIRRRGLERGLITPDVSSHQELAQLIFHPGFSTKQTTNQVSGRGVGMDVVAATLQRMRGWVDVDSDPTQGTRIRLSVPLPSMIQHVMAFRAAGQLFAVPMQSVHSAGAPDPTLQPTSICQLLDLPSGPQTTQQEMMVLGNQFAPKDSEHLKDVEQLRPRRVAILVDQIVGPEEVVVRPLPWLFKQHPVCSGATLSGMGEVMLLLDANRLSLPHPTAQRTTARVLVVDDSVSARTRVVRALSRYDLQIVQSVDGTEAWDKFQAAAFDAVFSDIDMPHMTGLELLAQIKQHSRGPQTPVVLVSSRTESSIHEQAAQLGAVACLPKPLTDEALDGVLSNLPFALSPTH